MWSFTSFSNQLSVITGPPTHKREVTVLSCVFNNKETNTKKKNIKTSTQDVIQQFSVTSILPCGLWRAEIQKSAQKTWEWNRKRIPFALHLICSYKVHQQFRVMTESYTEEETSTDLWGSSKRALCEQRNIKMVNSSIPQNEKLFFCHVIGFCQWELVLMRASRDLERSHRGVTASLSLACTSESPERHVLAAQQPNKATSDFYTKENHGWKKKTCLEIQEI